MLSINSRHPIIDAVLNQNYQAARDRGIEMQVRVNDLSALNLPTNAMVVLLSNLLENAVEACDRKEGDRAIHVSFLLGDEVFLSVENTSNPVQVVDGRIATSKSPAGEHGYGLTSIRRILQDLRAEFTYGYENGWFRFAAEIPLSSDGL